MTRTAFALLLAVAVVLAGCVGAVAHGPDATTDPGTATTSDSGAATSTTTAGTTEGETAFPPGVTEDGVTNATALIDAHRETLRATSYEFELRANSSMGPITQTTHQRGTVARDFFPFVSHANGTLERDDRTQQYDVDQWANDSISVYRYRIDDRVQYQKLYHEEDTARERDSGFAFPYVNRSDVESGVNGVGLLELTLRTGNFTVAETETVGDRTVTTLQATQVNRSSDFGDATVTQYDATIVVDDRGLVRELNVTLAFDDESAGEVTSMAYHFEVVRTGAVVVERPSWVDSAVQSVSTDVSIDAAETYFVVTNRGGDRLPAGSEIRVSHDGTNTTLRLEQPLQSGEQAFVYFPTDGREPVLTDDRAEAGEGQRVAGEYEFTVVDPTGNVLGQFGIGRSVSTESPGSVTPPGNETTTQEG